MRRKTTAALLAALCLILLLPGCGLRAAKDRPAVTPLSCTAPTALSALYPAGGSRLLVTWADYEQNRTTVQLVDADADTVRQETVLDGVWDLKEQSLSDGFALCDRENVVWQFLSSRLAQTGTWTAAENVDGYFSLDGGTYYFLRDSVLFRQQVDSGQPERMPLSCDLRILDITAFDAAAGRMAVQFLLSPYGSECGTALLDVTTGQLSMLCAQRYQAALAGISAMLDSMSRAFALYPQGFLAQFRNSVGEGGLCFLLVAHIASDYGVVGCAYDSADWQYIALDVQADYMREGTVCHEIWHATENEIRSRDYTAFDGDQWNRLNPEGFLYYGDGTMQDPAQPWTLYSSAPEDVRFVDTYSCVAATEDRARIMEFFMTHDDEAELLIQSPYIRAKLQIMCDAVRRYFDTSGWGTPRWERLL